MEDEKRACKDTKRLIVSIVVMIVLVWIVHTGYKLATEERRDTEICGSEDYYVALVFGVLTVVFGSVYFIVGLIVVAELALDLSTWFRAEDMEKETTNNQGREEKTIWQLTIQTSVTIGSMFLLAWAIHHGYKLTVEAPKGGIHNGLAFVVGFITIGFGFVYFVIGIGLIAESTEHLSDSLQEIIRSDICQKAQNQDADAYLAV